MNEISETTSSELIPIIKEFYDSLFDPKKRFTTLKGFDDVKDFGIVKFKGEEDVRKISLQYKGKSYELGIYNYIRENGNCLAIRNGETDRNFIQYVLDKFVQITNNTIVFSHDGIITGSSGKTKEACIEEILKIAPHLINLEGGKNVNLGSLEIGYKFENESFQSLIANFIEYSILRNNFKNDLTSNGFSNFIEAIEGYRIHLEANPVVNYRFKLNECHKNYVWVIDKINDFSDSECHYELILRDKNKISVEIHFEDKNKKSYLEKLTNYLPDNVFLNNKHKPSISFSFIETYPYDDLDLFTKIDKVLLFLNENLGDRIRRIKTTKYSIKEIEKMFKDYLDKVVEAKTTASAYLSAIPRVTKIGLDLELLDESLYELQDLKLLSQFQNSIVRDLDYKEINKTSHNGPSSALKKYKEFIANHFTSTTQESINEKSMNLNQILYGPPGTGKTYNSVNKALEIIDDEEVKALDFNDRKVVKSIFDKKMDEKQIVFTTFHQSMSYEDFVEGIKPKTKDNRVEYHIEDGLFKSISKKALAEYLHIGKSKSNDDFDSLYKDYIDKLKPKVGLKESIFTTKTGIEIMLVDVSDSSIQIKYLYTNNKKESEGIHVFSVTKDKLKKVLLEGVDPKKVKNLKSEILPIVGHIHCELFAVYKDFYEFILQNKGEIETVHFDYEEADYEDVLEEFLKLDTDVIQNKKVKSYVLIIDEINRGNVSQIFGELITLLEDSKRLGKEESLIIDLPYSKKKFGVPPNLFIIGTMNTADRSVEALDTALRRRFSFVEMMPNEKIFDTLNFTDTYNRKGIMQKINQRIEVLLDRNYTLGHSYFIKEDFKNSFENEIIPLLQEYFYNDYGKIGLVLGKGFVREKAITAKNDKSIFADFDTKNEVDINKSYELIPFTEFNFDEVIKTLLA